MKTTLLIIVIFIGLFVLFSSYFNLSNKKHIDFTLKNKSDLLIDSIEISIPSARVLSIHIPPLALKNVTLVYSAKSVPKNDGSFFYKIYLPNGNVRNGSFGYYTNGWVDLYSKYELTINRDLIIESKEFKD